MRLLIIGTLDGHMTSASKIALDRGAKVSSVSSIDEALNLLRNGRGADLALIDVRMNISRFVDQLDAERINLPVVACGIEGTDAKSAVEAIRSGAKEYLPLPPDPDLIAAVLEAASQDNSTVIHRDPAMQRTLQLATQIAPSDASVMITGESGTGKEVMARYIHNRSKRATGPFVALNCAAIPENLLESELFGHEKGAFSGAIARRVGKFEEANGGTLLLDEISEMDIRLQAKLLRAIQEREIDRLGGNKPVKVDVRILATSNRDMQKTVAAGQFREDLYFRLNVVTIALPSLRERPHDIDLLADHFSAKYAKANGVEERPLTEAARSRLRGYHWPGNVRELENTMHRAVLLAYGDAIDDEAILLTHAAPPEKPSALPAALTRPAETAETDTATAPKPTADQQSASVHGRRASDQPEYRQQLSQNTETNPQMVGRTVADVERQLIIDTLNYCLGNRTHAATILGISIRTLRNKLKQYHDEGYNVPAHGDVDA